MNSHHIGDREYRLASDDTIIRKEVVDAARSPSIQSHQLSSKAQSC